MDSAEANDYNNNKNPIYIFPFQTIHFTFFPFPSCSILLISFHFIYNVLPSLHTHLTRLQPYLLCLPGFPAIYIVPNSSNHVILTSLPPKGRLRSTRWCASRLAQLYDLGSAAKIRPKSGYYRSSYYIFGKKKKMKLSRFFRMVKKIYISKQMIACKLCSIIIKRKVTTKTIYK